MSYMQWLMAERKKMTEFGRVLWWKMQHHSDGEINRTELAERMTNLGFDTPPGYVSAWMNDTRTPPAGFPYYASLALGLDDKDRCEVAWSYLKQYKDRIRGRNEKGPDAEKGREIEKSRASEAGGKASAARDREN